MSRQVFDVGIVEPLALSGLSWLIKGRAIEDIQIGERVYLPMAGSPGSHRLTFEIVGCRSYGRDLPGLGRMMTGEIILHGAGGDLLREDDRLLAE